MHQVLISRFAKTSINEDAGVIDGFGQIKCLQL